MKRIASCVAVLFALSAPVVAQGKDVVVAITAQRDGNQVLVCAPLSLPASAAKMTFARIRGSLDTIGQITTPSLTTAHIDPSAKGQIRRDLHVLVPAMKKGDKLTLKVELQETNSVARPEHVPVEGDRRRTQGDYLLDARRQRATVGLAVHERQVRRLVEGRERSYKVFHHLFDPAGKRIVTNGGHTDLKDGDRAAKAALFPHHRGLMYRLQQVQLRPRRQEQGRHLALQQRRLPVAHEKYLARRRARSSVGNASCSVGTARRRNASPRKNAS